MEAVMKELLDFLVELGLAEAIANMIIVGVQILVWIIVGIILNFIVRRIIFRFIKATKDSKRSLTVGKLLNSVARYVIWFIIAISVLRTLDVDVAPIIATAGVLGLAIGFGAQEIVRDFISGFFIIFEGTFNVGEVIEVSGFKGTVLSLGLRTTSIENWKGEIKTVNNGDISSVVNYSRNNSVAIVDFGVDYDTDLEKLNGLMKEFVEISFEKYDDILELPNFLGVGELADSSINLKLICKTAPMNHFQVERNLRKDIVEFLGNNNIDIPFPHVVVKNA